MKRITHEEAAAALKAQGVDRLFLCCKCPACGTAQAPYDLIVAGAGKNIDDVAKYWAFSCVGRWTHGKPPPKKQKTQEGCNWTLGGLFRIHTVELVSEDGKTSPKFEICTPEEAKAHYRKLLGHIDAELIKMLASTEKPS